MLVISSELPEIVALSDRAYVMSRGRITGELTGEALTQEDIMRAATLGKVESHG